MSNAPNLVQQIKSRLRVQTYLEGKGIQFKEKPSGQMACCCPLHDEEEPSFTVNADGTYHCYGCQAHGDVINLFQALEGYSTIGEAISEIAKLLGIESRNRPVPRIVDSETAFFQKAMSIALATYCENLAANTEYADSARRYLVARGIKGQQIQDFRIGLGCVDQRLVQNLRNGNIDLAKAAAFGILGYNQETRQYYDNFWNRITFPILPDRGTYPVAFGGRDFVGNSQAKYKNSQGNKFYVKGNHLFAISLARNEIVRQGKAVMVEGYFDAVSLHQFGIANAVATCGTAITNAQLDLLFSHTKHIVFVYDPDNAGHDAAVRGVFLASQKGFKTSIVLLNQLDPDLYLQTYGGEAFRDLMENSQDGVGYQLLSLIENASPAETKDWIAALLKGTSNDTIRYVLQKKVALCLGVSVDDLRSALTRTG